MRRSADNTAVFRGLKICRNCWAGLAILRRSWLCTYSGIERKRLRDEFYFHGLTEGGYKTGRYISPTIFEYRERFQINGKYISKAELGKFMEPVRDAAEAMAAEGKNHPTAFEMETALAFLWFREKKCDIVVLETGMGGPAGCHECDSGPASLCADLHQYGAYGFPG